MTDRELCDIIERVRVDCSRHRDATYALGGIYALDTVKPLLREAERRLAEASSPATGWERECADGDRIMAALGIDGDTRTEGGWLRVDKALEAIARFRVPHEPDPLSGREYCPRCGSGPRQAQDIDVCPDCGRRWAGPPLISSPATPQQDEDGDELQRLSARIARRLKFKPWGHQAQLIYAELLAEGAASPATPAGPVVLINRLADEIQKRGRKHASGEPLYFDRCNLETAIADALAGVARLPASQEEKS